MVDLRTHGDTETLGDGLDLCVNVVSPTPTFMADAVRAACADLSAYPDPAPAHAELAEHLGVDPDALLLTAGGAEAFTLVARLRHWERPVVVHPQFTEPEAALVSAGHRPDRLLCEASEAFALNPGAVPRAADLVSLGNPTNPTSRLHPREAVLDLLAPARTVLVDEAFMDATDEAQSVLSDAATVPGLVVVRSLTKTYGIPGVRAGYLVAHPDTVALLRALQTPWAVGTPALAAVRAVCTPAAGAHAAAWRAGLGPARDDLARVLEARGLEVVAPAAAPFLLARRADAAILREALRRRGVALRRGDTFPGLGPEWLRVAVRDRAAHERLGAALDHLDSTDEGAAP